MRDRPISTGIICWYLIIAYTIALIYSFAKLSDMEAKMATIPLPLSIQITQFYIGLIVPLVTAIFMYEAGSNWARIVYIAWGVLNYSFEAIVLPDKVDLLPGMPIFAIISIFLLLPGPSSYFRLPRHHS